MKDLMKQIIKIGKLVLSGALFVSISLVGSHQDISTIDKNSGQLGVSLSDNTLIHITSDDSGSSDSSWSIGDSGWGFSVGVDINVERGKKKLIFQDNSTLPTSYPVDPYQQYSNYNIGGLRAGIESKYGSPLSALSYSIKKEIIDTYPLLFKLFEVCPMFTGSSPGSAWNTILSDLCRDDLAIQSYVRGIVGSYSFAAGYIEGLESFSFNQVQEVVTTAERWGLGSNNGEPKGDFGEAGQKLKERSRLLPVEEKARSEDMLRHRNELGQVVHNMDVLDFPKDPDIHNVSSRLRGWLNEFMKLDMDLPQEREDRDRYGKDQIADAQKSACEKSLQHLGLLHKGVNNPNVLEQYIKNDGLTIHKRIKETIFDCVDELATEVRSKKWPCVKRLHGDITKIYRHAFYDVHEGYIAKPNRLLVLAQAMTLMAKCADKNTQLDFSLGFVNGADLYPHVKNTLLRSHGLYWTPSYRLLLQRIPGYSYTLRQLHHHVNNCVGCSLSTRPPCSKECVKNPPPPIQIDPGAQKARFVRTINTALNDLEQQEKEEREREQEREREEAERAEQEEKYIGEQRDLLLKSKLGNYVDYVGQKKKEYRELRDQQLFNYDLTGELPVEQLSDESVQVLQAHSCSVEPFISSVSSPLQQIWQNEFIGIVNDCAQIKIDSSNDMAVHLSSSAIQFAEVGAWSIQTDVKQTVELLADCCYALLDLTKAVVKGVVTGGGQTIVQAPGFIVDPVGSVAQDCQEAYHAGCQVAAALQQVCEITLDEMTDYSGKEEWEVGYTRINNLQQRLDQQARRVDGYDEYLQGVEDTVAAATRVGLKSIVLWVTSRAITGIAQRAAVGLGQIGPYIGNPSVTIRLDGTATAAATIADVITVVVRGAAEAAKAALSKWDLLPNFMKGDEKPKKYKTVEEIRDDAGPKFENLGDNVRQGKIKGDAQKIFEDLAEQAGEKIELRNKGRTKIFGKEPNVVSVHSSKYSGLPTISFKLPGEDGMMITYKIRIMP